MTFVMNNRSCDRRTAWMRGLVAMALLVSMLGAAGAVGGRRTAAQSDATGVTTLTGAVKVTNPYILGAYRQNYVALIDMTGFVKRDREMPLPDFTQVTVDLSVFDLKHLTAIISELRAKPAVNKVERVTG